MVQSGCVYTRGGPARGVRRPAWLWLALVLSLVLTGVAWHVTRVNAAARASERFRFRVALIETAIQQRLATHLNLLRGAVGLFDASGQVSADEWQRYVNAVRPEISTPGLQAIGFSARVPRTEHDPFERLVQARRWPFAIWPTGERDEFHAVVYVYPFDGDNLRAFGYDMFTEPVRREAMMRARDQNTTAMSGHLRLVQEQSQDSAQPGFLLYLPVYQPVDIAGRRWLLLARPSTRFSSFADRYQSWLIAGVGLAVNLLVGAGLWVSAAVRTRASAMAEEISTAVRVSEAQTQLRVDSITDHAIFRLDAERHVTSWNGGAQRMLGYTERDVLGRPASRFWIGADANPYSNDLGDVAPQVREGWHARKDGHRFWGAAAVAPLQQGARDSSGYVVILRDDSGWRQAIEALAATSAELEQRTVELGRFNRLASGRELRMIELKRMVNERSVRLGMKPPFDLSFADDFADVLTPGEPS